MSDIALKVLDYIQQNPGTSYVEIECVFKSNGFDFEGDLEIYDGEFDNIIFWSGWNEEAIMLMIELQHVGLITKEPAEPIIYLIDGKSLRLPLVERIKQYNTPHWLPVAFVVTPQVSV